jgi:hypothetical protein
MLFLRHSFVFIVYVLYFSYRFFDSYYVLLELVFPSGYSVLHYYNKYRKQEQDPFLFGESESYQEHMTGYESHVLPWMAVGIQPIPY